MTERRDDNGTFAVCASLRMDQRWDPSAAAVGANEAPPPTLQRLAGYRVIVKAPTLRVWGKKKVAGGWRA